MCYGNDKFIACEWIGNVGAYSTDGMTWHPITLPQSGEWKLCYGNGKYVAVNDDIGADLDKGAMYSTDGIVWFPANMPARAYRESVCYGNGKFVFVSFDGGYSSDGINWFPSNLGNRYATVCYGNNKFVALGFNFNKAIYCDGELYIKKDIVDNRFYYYPYYPITSLTTKACTKLKQVYGDNIKIHIIKYRKDSGNYSYLDDCAVSTGRKVYDISNQADLKVKLDEIATELKTWAGRTEAKNVD